MKIEIERLLDDLGIAYTTTGKHARPGWIQIECPLCTGNPGWHGGFNIARGYYNCWRCGWKPIEEVLQSLTGQTPGQIKKLLKAYFGDWVEEQPVEPEKPRIEQVKFPLGIGPLQKQHKEYLKSRNLDPEKIEAEWELLGTGPLGDYKFRIIAPIHYQHRIVSYQGRDITNRSQLPYKACPMAHEVIHHKHVIYGLDKARSRLLIVEGIFDVWNIGPGAGGTFGIDFTKEQVIVLNDFPGRKFIMFDANEEKAQEQAEMLAYQLDDSDVIILDYGDPGELPAKDVAYLRKDLGL